MKDLDFMQWKVYVCVGACFTPLVHSVLCSSIASTPKPSLQRLWTGVSISASSEPEASG